jgi:hypothetical protein
MQKLLIITGIIVIAIGLFWPWFVKIPFGRLPGDIIISRENFKFYFPLTTMIMVLSHFEWVAVLC